MRSLLIGVVYPISALFTGAGSGGITGIVLHGTDLGGATPAPPRDFKLFWFLR